MKKTALIGEMVSQEERTMLQQLGIHPVCLPPFLMLECAIQTHPDLLMCIIDRYLVTFEEYFQYAKKEITDFAEENKLEIIRSAYSVRSPYPFDIAYNVFTIGGYLFGNVPFLCPELLTLSSKIGLEVVKINQGYAACSTIRVKDRAIITADAGIAAAADSVGINVLQITPGYIALPGYAYGFIGGASGMVGDTLCFFGEIKAHPDYEHIRAFCQKYHVDVRALSACPLTDCGGIFCMKAFS